MTMDKEQVKSLLDAQCWDVGWYKCRLRRFTGKDKSPGMRDQSIPCECWQCHENDDLAARIADLEVKE